MISPPPPPCRYDHVLNHVDVCPHSWPVPGSWRVTPCWDGVDLRRTTSWVVRPDGLDDSTQCRELAVRLAKLILNGRGFSRVEPLQDIEGQTYMSASQRFSVMELEQDIDWLEQEELS